MKIPSLKSCPRLQTTRRHSHAVLAFALGGLMMFATAAQAQFTNGTISVDFNSNNNGNNNIGLVPAGPNAVVTPGQWNEIDATSGMGTGVALTNAAGAATSVTMSYTAQSSFDVLPYMSQTEIQNSPNLGLLEDFIYTTDTANPSTVTLTGLSAVTSYNLYLYSGGNSEGRTTVFSVGNVPSNATFEDSDTTFVPGDNYVQYLGIKTDGLGTTLTISFYSGGNEGDFNGFQLIALGGAPAPEPSSFALLALGGISGLGVAARRRLQTSRHA